MYFFSLENKNLFKNQNTLNFPNLGKCRCPVPERSISVNPGLKFCILYSYALLRVTFCVITTVSPSKGSTVFCNLELHVLRRESRAWNLALSWVKLSDLSTNRARVVSSPAGGNPLYQAYRYVPPQRVGFTRPFGLKTGIDFAHFGLESSMVFKGTTGA